VAGLTLAALAAFQPARAHAEPLPPPSEPHGIAAGHVCKALDASPTVATFLAEAGEMWEAGYTEQQENKVMWFAMTYYCPEYKPLAYASLRHPPKVVYA
jgi:Protein of unknown function (DUF732)